MKPSLVSPHYQAAYSLIEASIVLGLVGLIIGGIWIAAAAVRENNRLNDFSRDIVYMASAIPMVFNARNNPAPAGSDCNASVDITDAVAKAGIVPKTWMLNGSVKAPLGSYFYLVQWGQGVMGGTGGDINNSGAVSIIIDGITYTECRKLMPAFLAAAKNTSTFNYMDVGTTGGGGTCTWGSATTYSMPFTGNIDTMCSTSAPNRIQLMLKPG